MVRFSVLLLAGVLTLTAAGGLFAAAATEAGAGSVSPYGVSVCVIVTSLSSDPCIALTLCSASPVGYPLADTEFRGAICRADELVVGPETGRVERRAGGGRRIPPPPS